MRLARIAALVSALAGPLLSWPQTVQAAEPADLAKAELIAEPAAVRAGEPFWVGVRLRMREGWHTYWRNPGDSGEATSITWTLPPGFAAGPIQWPVPRRIPVAHLANFGYEGETALLTRITPPADLDRSAPVTIAAAVTWLVCEKECVPGEAKLALTLPVAAPGTAPEPKPDMRGVFDAARAALPNPSPWAARMAIAGDDITLHIDGKGLRADTLRSAYFFPFDGMLATHAAPQKLDMGADGLALTIKRSALSSDMPAERGGVLVLEERLGDRSVPQAFELTGVALAGAASASGQTTILAVLQAALLALAGGLILNLMPCVFPVLSIKVLGLINHAGEPANRVRRHGLAYTAGVLASFLALGGLLLAVRAAGAEVGWGFQLQSPLAITALAYVLFAVGLNLSGVFHVGASLQGVGQAWAQRSGLSGSFFTGALAAVVATPCTAPFMATAVGFAMTQSAVVSLTVFLALGLGLALPFLALTFAPGLVSRLPRPGAWMETLKQVLAFPLYATVAWLIWVLAQQVGPSSLFGALVGLVLVGLAAWSFHFAQTSGLAGRRVALATVAAALLGTGAALYALEPVGSQPSGAALAASSGAGIEPFSQRRLDELRAERRPVFVNMTAAWCITCLVNDKAVLSTEAVRNALAARNVAYLKGDWTNRNAEITRVLERHGRSGVPLYLLYTGNNDNAEVIVLPQILTPGAVLAEIERIPVSRQRKASLATKE
jgi:thiol:disulfide interchange protein/DsbC/DsbD-like thiol-disulfide interchange protein